MNRPRPIFLLSALAFGYAFLYLPILSLIVYSFNDSRLVTVWGGFSTKWYAELLANEQMLEAAWLSLRIAAINATLAVLLGTLAGLALTRFGRFRGRTAVSAADDRAAGDAGRITRAVLAAAVRRPGTAARLARKVAASLPSPSPMSPSARPMSRWWCSRA